MHHHPRRLVHHEHVLVLEHDRDRERLPLHLALRGSPGSRRRPPPRPPAGSSPSPGGRPRSRCPVAISVAACVRERSSRCATSESRRTSLSASAVNASRRPGMSPGAAGMVSCSARAAVRWRPRRGAPARLCGRDILLPEDPREQQRAHAHAHVGDVERRPAMRADADIEEVHDALRRAEPVDQVADRAADDHRDRRRAQHVAVRASRGTSGRGCPTATTVSTMNTGARSCRRRSRRPRPGCRRAGTAPSRRSPGAGT